MMKSDNTTDYGLFKIGALYKLSAIKRSIIIWLCFQGILWIIFGISYITNKEAWLNVVKVDPVTASVGGWWSSQRMVAKT